MLKVLQKSQLFVNRDNLHRDFSFSSRFTQAESYLYLHTERPKVQIKDFSQYTPNLSTYPMSTLDSLSKEYGLITRGLNSEINFSETLLIELAYRLNRNDIDVLKFCESAKNLSITSKSISFINTMFKDMIEVRYLNMKELSQMIDLVFNFYRSRDFESCRKAAILLEKRVSQGFIAKDLMDTVNTCTRIYHFCPEVEDVLEKIHLFLVSKVEIDEIEDSLRVFEIYNECEIIHKNLFQSSLKYISNLDSKALKKLPLITAAKISYNISELMRKKYVYMSYSFKNLLHQETIKKINLNDLKMVNMGVFYNSLVSINTQMPIEIIQVIEKNLLQEKNCNHSFVLAYMNLFLEIKRDLFVEINSAQKKSLRSQPFSEIIKIFNTLHNSKAFASNYLKKFSLFIDKLMNEYSENESLENILEIFNGINNKELYKRPFGLMIPFIMKCVSNFGKYKNSIDRYIFINQIMKVHLFCPLNVEELLNDIIHNVSIEELTEYLRHFDSYPQRVINFIVKSTNMDDNNKLLILLTNITHKSGHADLVETSKMINQLSGSVFDADFFESSSHIFFKNLYSKDLEFHCKPFMNSIISFIKTLPDDKLLGSKILNTLKWGKLFEIEDKTLNEKILILNQDDAIYNIEDYIILSEDCKNEQIKDFIIKFLLSELRHTWYNLDFRELATRIRSIASLNWLDQKDEEEIKRFLSDKFYRYHNLNLDDLILLLNELKSKVFYKNNKLIDFIFDQVSRRIKRDDFFISNRQLVEICQNICKFHVDNQSLYRSMFTEIGKHYLKLSIEQKMSVLKSLTERGFTEKEIYKSVLTDLCKYTEMNKDMIAEALCYVSHVNLEETEFFAPFITKLKFIVDKRFLTSSILKLYFLFAKTGAKPLEINSFMDENNFPSNYFCESPRMFLSCYIYYKSSSVKFAENEMIEEIKKLDSPNELWGVHDDIMINVKKELIKEGLDVEEFVDVEGIVVPFKVKGENIVIIPKTVQNSIFNLSEMRGEYQLFAKGLKNLNYQVLLYDGKRNEGKLHPIPDINKTN